MSVSVIIPTLNEEDWIAGAVESAFAAGAAEVIVVDGGSHDRTARFATAAGARVLLAEPMRARQLNRGAEAASNPTLIFLHADSRLPSGAAAAVEDALQARLFGGFRLRFIEADSRLRIAAKMINARTWVTRAPWGDQGQFIRRETLLACGGFREIAIMEDYELATRMRRAGPVRILPMTIATSGRRFLQRGMLRTAIVNWLTIWRYHQGVDPEELARAYRA
ncbi:MAG TPA: TIGR04283 family arsenosugar biosynthesis glycosyltransferase [Thermoanaerobaculia bacterium]|nr:TIGR04283 family arsenosugar biosynthesis glycosyltransferase [Thermoanaerobaculia bacterium]